ncbi:MAG: hypothetical protein ACI9LE_000851 [Paraglaciecola sp.]|jgi:hypothetical protein
MQAITFRTRNNASTQGYWFTPLGTDDKQRKGQIVIASAMGVTQAYY